MSHESSLVALAPAALGRVELKREARTSAILDAAMVILAAEGHDALTLGRLAKALGYVPAALYRYFDSKDALLAALQRRAVSAIHAGLLDASRALEPRIAGAPPAVAAIARLIGSARFYLAVPRTDPEAAFLVALLLGEPRPLPSDDESHRTAPLLLALLGGVAAMFQEAAGCSALSKGNSLERTLALWATLTGALSLEKARRIAPALPSSTEIGGAAVLALLAGWGAAPRDLARASRLVAHETSRSKRDDSRRKNGARKARA